MNNIYVDELPKNCEKCPCYSYSEGFCNCEYWYQKYGEIKDVAEYTHLGLKENERPADCPLKPLSDRIAEERKKVVQEIRERLTKYTLTNDDFIFDTYYKAVDVEKVLDKIERGV